MVSRIMELISFRTQSCTFDLRSEPNQVWSDGRGPKQSQSCCSRSWCATTQMLRPSSGLERLVSKHRDRYIRIRIFESLWRKSKVAGVRSGFVILTALLLSGSAAVAQTGKPCAADIKKLCAGIQPGEGRIKACIKSHLTELSPACQDRVLTVAVDRKGVQDRCYETVCRHCAGHRRY